MRGDKLGGPIRWRMHLPVRPEVVYEALDSDEGRASFWAESAVEQAGHIEFRFVNGVETSSRILQRSPPSLWCIEYFGTEVRFELNPDGEEGTDLLLVNSDVGEDDWIETHAGWLNVLFPLKGWIAHRVDLRSHDPQRTWNHGYADQ